MFLTIALNMNTRGARIDTALRRGPRVAVAGDNLEPAELLRGGPLARAPGEAAEGNRLAPEDLM